MVASAKELSSSIELLYKMGGISIAVLYCLQTMFLRLWSCGSAVKYLAPFPRAGSKTYVETADAYSQRAAGAKKRFCHLHISFMVCGLRFVHRKPQELHPEVRRAKRPALSTVKIFGGSEGSQCLIVSGM